MDISISNKATQTGKYLGIFGAIWGFTGAFILIGFAVWRLTPVALEVVNYPMSILQWAILLINTLFMAYSEGYKGFQQAFSPRVAARALYISHHPRPWFILLAPFFVLGYFHATRKRIITSYVLTSLIIGVVILVRFLDQPWRGIIDVGVVIGLLWGLASMLYFFVRAFSKADFSYSPETPITDT